MSESSPMDERENSRVCRLESTSWIGYSDMDKMFYNVLMGAFTLGASLVTHPLTVLSVRQQAGEAITGEVHRSGNIYLHMRDALRSVGFRGMFRGWVPMAALGAPSNIIYFDLMEKTREDFQHRFRSILPDAPDYAIDFAQTVCSSSVATFVSLIPFVPAEVLSSRLIVQGKHGIGSLQMSREMFRDHGWRGFFRGFGSSFIVGMVGGAQWWYSYSLCRKYGMETDLGKDHPLLIECGAGLVSGVTSTIVAHPMDTIKTRIMTSCLKTTPHSFVSLYFQVIRTESHRVLFRGMPAAVYQAALGSTLFAGLYELIKDASKNS